MRKPDFLIREVSDFQNLENAYHEVSDWPDPPEGVDSWLIEIQNNLLWGTYVVCRDADADSVVLEAIVSVASRMRLGAYDITGETRRILDELTLV